MATDDIGTLVAYLGEHPEVTSVLITGGDPMIMGEAVLRRYLEPLIDPGNASTTSSRSGSAPSRWPTGRSGSSATRTPTRPFGCSSEVVASGRTLAVMAHFSHPRELEPPVLAEAVRRIRGTGAVIRTQAPLIRSINDDPEAWRAMWRTQVRMGMVPYYMFVERDTGPQDYFAVPLARGYEIFREAYQGVSGLGRTVRGPSMSATPGKVCVDGVDRGGGIKVFVLRMIQARDPQPGGDAVFRQVRPSGLPGSPTWSPCSRPGSPTSPARYEAVPDETARALAQRAGRAGRADGPGHLTGVHRRTPHGRNPGSGQGQAG